MSIGLLFSPESFVELRRFFTGNIYVHAVSSSQRHSNVCLPIQLLTSRFNIKHFVEDRVDLFSLTFRA